MMRNIVIVECISTGINFIQDIVNRNYNPIVLETKLEDGDYGVYRNLRKEEYGRIAEDFVLLEEKESYDETLEMVREYDPLLVIPGSEHGVILATRLAHDLNLKGNSVENLDAMTLKDKMQERLAEKGLRHIRGKTIRSVEEAIEYYDESGFKDVVVKPVYSAGSVGVRICLNRQEMIDALSGLFNELNIYGDELTEFVIQERIKGDEYVVNTVSCNGDHRICSMWKYNKIRTSEGGQIYESHVSINELGLGEADLAEYAYDVADALGIQYGAVHGEYMLDENGPVLIEVNCRPQGAGMSIDFLDMIFGQHETDSILDSYLDPDRFNFKKLKGYKSFAHGAAKFIIVPTDIVAESSPMNYISNNLRSHHETRMGITDQSTHHFVKTQDLETTGGTIYLAHEDGYAVQRDLEFLRSIERYAFQLVLSDRSDKKTVLDENELYGDVKFILSKINLFGTTLFVTDEIFDDINLLQVVPDEIEGVNGIFDCVVVNLNRSILNKKDDYVAYLLLNIIKKVKTGGLIFIPETTYQYLPDGRLGVEALLIVLDLKLELPLNDLQRVVIASKRL